jgi:hypothetical protein
LIGPPALNVELRLIDEFKPAPGAASGRPDEIAMVSG